MFKTKSILAKMCLWGAISSCLPSIGIAATIPFTQQQMKKAHIQAYQLQSNAGDMPSNTLTLNGTVSFTPQGQTVVSTPTAGVIRTINVANMQQVKKGQSIAAVYSPEVNQLQAEYLKTTAALKLARQQLTRENTLFNEGIIAHKRVMDQQNAVQILQITQQQQAKMLSFIGAAKNNLNPVINVYAPISGVVGQVNVTTGQNIAAGTSLATLQNNADIELQLNASEQQIGRIQQGAAVVINGCNGSGKVKHISNQVNGQTQTRTVYTTLPQGCGEPNQFMTATVAATPESIKGWVVPNNAIVLNNNQPFVFVVKADGFNPVNVKVTPQNNQQSIIYSSELKAGQYVATSGTTQIKGVWNGLGADQAPHKGAPIETKDTP